MFAFYRHAPTSALRAAAAIGRTSIVVAKQTDRPPDATTPPPAPIVDQEGMARRVTRLTQLYSARTRGGRRVWGNIRTRARERPRRAILIATQENEFSRSADLINAYLDAAFWSPRSALIGGYEIFDVRQSEIAREIAVFNRMFAAAKFARGIYEYEIKGAVCVHISVIE